MTPWVKLLPEQPDETPEFDKNVQTTSGRGKVIFRLKNPQIVDCIRTVPRNADNIIVYFIGNRDGNYTNTKTVSIII